MMRKLGMMTILLWMLSGCSSMPWLTTKHDGAAQALSMAQTENENLKSEENQLRQTLDTKKAELGALRAASQ